MDFVEVDESNARWVQDFRLKAYASPAKLESIDGEGPRPWRGGHVGFLVGLWPPQRSLTLFLEHPRACCQALTVPGRLQSCLLGPGSSSSPWEERWGALGDTRGRDDAWALGTSGALAGGEKVTKDGVWWLEQRGLTGLWSPLGARYHALLIPSCPGALADLASSGSLARILQHFRSESSR